MGLGIGVPVLVIGGGPSNHTFITQIGYWWGIPFYKPLFTCKTARSPKEQWETAHGSIINETIILVWTESQTPLSFKGVFPSRCFRFLPGLCWPHIRGSPHSFLSELWAQPSTWNSHRNEGRDPRMHGSPSLPSGWHRPGREQKHRDGNTPLNISALLLSCSILLPFYILVVNTWDEMTFWYFKQTIR